MALVFYSVEEKPRKQRASRPKVRTGCVTCKYGPRFPGPLVPWPPDRPSAGLTDSSIENFTKSAMKLIQSAESVPATTDNASIVRPLTDELGPRVWQITMM